MGRDFFLFRLNEIPTFYRCNWIRSILNKFSYAMQLYTLFYRSARNALAPFPFCSSLIFLPIAEQCGAKWMMAKMLYHSVYWPRSFSMPFYLQFSFHLFTVFVLTWISFHLIYSFHSLDVSWNVWNFSISCFDWFSFCANWSCFLSGIFFLALSLSSNLTLLCERNR